MTISPVFPYSVHPPNASLGRFNGILCYRPVMNSGSFTRTRRLNVTCQATTCLHTSTANAIMCGRGERVKRPGCFSRSRADLQKQHGVKRWKGQHALRHHQTNALYWYITRMSAHFQIMHNFPSEGQCFFLSRACASVCAYQFISHSSILCVQLPSGEENMAGRKVLDAIGWKTLI